MIKVIIQQVIDDSPQDNANWCLKLGMLNADPVAGQLMGHTLHCTFDFSICIAHVQYTTYSKQCDSYLWFWTIPSKNLNGIVMKIFWRNAKDEEDPHLSVKSHTDNWAVYHKPSPRPDRQAARLHSPDDCYQGDQVPTMHPAR